MKRRLLRTYPALREAQRRVKVAPPGQKAGARRQLIRAMAECLRKEVPHAGKTQV